LAAEQTKAADMSNKISFYGQAYKKLQDKLAGVLCRFLPTYGSALGPV
jgi:hypothetical protein